jgi:hypothetical protein
MGVKVDVVVLRACMVDGNRVEPGTRLAMEPLEAAPLIEGAKARLARERDFEAVKDAVRAHVRRHTGSGSDPFRGDISPWRT